jgi:hypothetical protein
MKGSRRISDGQIIMTMMVATLLYILFLAIVYQDWARAAISGIGWGILMIIFFPRALDWWESRKGPPDD